MKKSLIVFLVLACFSVVFLAAEEAPGFDNYVDFSISLRELDRIAEKGLTGRLENKYLILDGSVSEYQVVDKNEASYTVEVELVSGEWDGVTDVYIYRCIVVFKGKKYMEMFPERRRSVPGPQEVALNSGIVAVAKLKEVRRSGKDSTPVLDGFYLRRINK